MKRNFGDQAIGILTGLVGLVLLLVFYMFNMDMRWLAALLILFIGYIIFQQIRDKHIFLLHVTVFLLPFTGGFLYSPLIRNDLIFAFDAVFFVLFGWWVFETHLFQKTSLFIHRSTIPAAGMILWAMLAIPLVRSRVSAVLGIFLLFKAFLIYFYVINKIKYKHQLKVIVNMLMAGLGIQGLLGIMQKIMGHGLGLGFLGEKQINYSVSEISRVRGTLAVPNQYGAYLILLIPIAMSFYTSTKSKKEKLWYGGVLAFSIMGLFLSLSRSSWFGLIGAIIVMLSILYKKKQLSPKLLKGIAVVSLVMILIAVMFWNVIVMRFETGEKGQFRKVMIEVAFPIIMSNPILGVGLFNYQYHSYSSFKFWHPVHNSILHITAEMGFPGIILFLWFTVLFFKAASQNLKLRDPYYRALNLGIIGSYTAFLIAVQFGPEYQHYRQKVLYWLLGALVIASTRIAKNEVLLRQKAENKKRIKEVDSLEEKLTAFQKSHNDTNAADEENRYNISSQTDRAYLKDIYDEKEKGKEHGSFKAI